MKASLVILFLASFALLSYAQIAGAVNEAPKNEDLPQDFSEDEDVEKDETPMSSQSQYVIPTIDNTGYTQHEKTTKKHPAPVSFKSYH